MTKLCVTSIKMPLAPARNRTLMLMALWVAKQPLTP